MLPFVLHPLQKLLESLFGPLPDLLPGLRSSKGKTTIDFSGLAKIKGAGVFRSSRNSWMF